MTTKTKAKKKPRSAIFHKEIVTEGVYHVTGPDGNLVKREVTRPMLEKMVATGQKLLSKGYKIPAPWKHDKNVVIAKFEEGNGGLLEDSTANGGFWKTLVGRINEEGKYTVSGDVEVPGDPNDPKTPAGKVGTSVQETSIYMKGSHQLTDESGEVLEAVPMHIALVTHSIEPGQKNFELLDANDLTIAMSQLVDSEEKDEKPDVDPDAEGSMSQAIELLGSVAKIFVPKSVTIESFFTHLVTALEQMKLSCNPKEDSGSSQSSQTFTMEPIVMAKLSNDQIEALLAGKPNPVTGKPFTKEELSDGNGSTETKAQAIPQELQEQLKQMNVMMSQLAHQAGESTRANYRLRITNLIERGTVTKDHADKNLLPLVDKFTPSTESPLENILMSLESVPAPNSLALKMLDGSYLVGDSFGDGNETDSKFQDEVADELANLI